MTSSAADVPTDAEATAHAAPDRSHWRPALHYTAQQTWLNDPNGLVFDGSTYHLYYQNNPHGPECATMSWGHATSPDLFSWTEHATALMHTEQEQIFSGSVVVDHTNTSGLGDGRHPPLVALYTSAYTDVSPTPRRQAQSLAWSTDSGMTWLRSAANPILDRNSGDFRDPKVFRYVPPGGEWVDGWWVMVVVEAPDHLVLLYRSDDLHSWELLSQVGPVHAVGGLWECPDLFPLPIVDSDGAETGESRWVLVISIHPGGPHGGSAMQYLVGSFDGATFTLDPDLAGTTLWVDGGRDYYAAVSFDNVPEHRLMIGWVGNWDYAQQVPSTGWRGVMSLPRVVDLQQTTAGLRLRQRLQLPSVTPSGVLVERLTLSARDTSHTTVRISSSAGDEVQVILDGAARTIGVDRIQAGGAVPGDSFPSGGSASLATEAEEIDVLLIVDGCVLTVVAEGGLTVLTHLVFPDVPLTTVRVDA